MRWFRDIYQRRIRLTIERQQHIVEDHPEMRNQLQEIEKTLLEPDIVVRSRTDPEVELFHRYYPSSPVSEKYMCVVVKASPEDPFVITAFFTDKVKRGEILWEKR